MLQPDLPLLCVSCVGERLAAADSEAAAKASEATLGEGRKGRMNGRSKNEVKEGRSKNGSISLNATFLSQHAQAYTAYAIAAA